MIYSYHLLRAMNSNNSSYIDFTPTLQSTPKNRGHKWTLREQIENFNWRIHITHTYPPIPFSSMNFLILTLSLCASLVLSNGLVYVCSVVKQRFWPSSRFFPYFSRALHSNQSTCEWAINFVDGGSGKAENLSFIKIICSFWGFVQCFAVLVLRNSEAWQPQCVYVWSKKFAAPLLRRKHTHTLEISAEMI